MRQRLAAFRADRWQRFRSWLCLGALVAAAAVLAVAGAANAGVPVMHWQVLGRIPARGRSAQALAIDPQSGAVYVGMERGMFVSRDGGLNWEPLGAGIPISSSSLLAFDAKQSALFGTDGNILFRMTGGGWQVFTVSAANGARPLSAQGRRAIWGLTADGQRDVMYVGSLREFLRSVDGGQTWEWQSSLPTEGQTLALDELQGAIYVTSLTTDELYRSGNGGRTWSILARDSVGVPLSYLGGWAQWGAMGRWIDGNLFWAAEGMQGLWELPRVILDSHNCVARAVSSSKAELVCAWGLMLMRADLQAMPLPWLALRLSVWQSTTWLAANAALALESLTILLSLLLAAAMGWTYLKVSRPWGLPLWAAWFAPRQVERYARPAALEAAWPAWEKKVRAELARFGDVIPADLTDVPAQLRRYALRRYAAQNAPVEWLNVRPGRVSLGAEALTFRRPDAEWRPCSARPDGDDRAGRLADAQARLLAEALKINLGGPQVLAGARVYLAEPVALPGAAPAHFQLMVLEAVWVETIRTLANQLQKNPDDFGLLMLPEDEGGAAELLQAMTHFSPVRNFVVLGQDEVWRLRMAREPRQVLADLIGK